MLVVEQAYAHLRDEALHDLHQHHTSLPAVPEDAVIHEEDPEQFLRGVDRILDMLRTATNVTGDCSVTILVDSAEKKFDAQAAILQTETGPN